MDWTRILLVCLIGIYSVLANDGDTEKKEWNQAKFREEAGQTFNLVFHKYNPWVRPPLSLIEVEVTTKLRHLRHLDLKKQEMQTVVDIEMSWEDPRLVWYPDRVFQIITNASSVWTPDIAITNSASPARSHYPDLVRISDKGRMQWSRKQLLTTHCPTEPDKDIQHCNIHFGFISNSRGDQIDRFFKNTSSLELDSDFRNHNWNLVDAALVLDDGTHHDDEFVEDNQGDVDDKNNNNQGSSSSSSFTTTTRVVIIESNDKKNASSNETETETDNMETSTVPVTSTTTTTTKKPPPKVIEPKLSTDLDIKLTWSKKALFQNGVYIDDGDDDDDDGGDNVGYDTTSKDCPCQQAESLTDKNNAPATNQVRSLAAILMTSFGVIVTLVLSGVGSRDLTR